MADNNCILCGKCMEVCPLLRATGREELSPRAKADLAALLRSDPGLLNQKSAAELAGLCLGCGRCKEKCPQGVDVPALVASLRAAHPGFAGWLWKTWLKRARELWSGTGLAARLMPDTFQPEKLAPMLKALTLLKSGNRPGRFARVDEFSDTHRGKTALLFSGCTARFVRPDWQDTALALMHGLGMDVTNRRKDRFRCCGIGLAGAGFAKDAAEMRMHNLETWRKAGKPMIVTLCASCHAGLADHARHAQNEEEAAHWLDSITPLSELLRGTRFVVSEDAPLRIGYHRPCHVDKNDCDHMFLAGLLEERLHVPNGRDCCGFGGIMRLRAPDTADPVNVLCWQGLGNPDLVLTGCSACAAQLGATAPAGTLTGHWLEIIADIPQ